jgi:hypothetical protein
LDALQGFPDNCDNIQVAKGNALLIKKDIFKNLMWYVLPDSNKQYPVTIERVRKIKSLNAQGTIPDDLEPVEITSSKAKEAEPEFVELVGQISLQSLERADKKRKQKQQQPRQQRQQPPQQQRGQQQRGPQQNPNRPPQGGQQRGPNRPPQQPRRDK